MTSTNGSEETNPTTGDNVTENKPQITGDWRTATNKVIADNLVKSLEQLLDGKAHYVECSDRTTYHSKIVIEYNHTNK